MLAADLALNPDELVTPRDWGREWAPSAAPSEWKLRYGMLALPELPVSIVSPAVAAAAAFGRLPACWRTSPITRLASLQAASTEAAVVAGRGALPLLSFLLVSIVVHSAVAK
jgi:hypothetical protein